MDNSVVIVGAGLAGVRAAFAAREAGYQGRVVLLSAENIAPYDRPPLSKAVLISEEAEAKIGLEAPQLFDGQRIELRIGRAAVKIERHSHELRLDDGTSLPYGQLVLATGSQVRILKQLPPGAPGVHYLRNIEDARALRAALQPGARVAIVGGGVIGMEVAAVAASKKLRVRVIEAGPRILGRGASAVVSEALARVHRLNGVDLYCGVAIEKIEAQAAGYRLALDNGVLVDADVVVVGIGVQPSIELAVDAGLETVEQGIVVDGAGRTSDEAIFAAGECAFHFNALSGRHERQENWMHAAAHGRHVGQSLAARVAADYSEPTSYWSDQYDRTLQVFGSPNAPIEIVRGDPTSGSFLCFHVDDDHVIVGVSALNAARDFRKARSLVLRRASADLKSLSDPSADIYV